MNKSKLFQLNNLVNYYLIKNKDILISTINLLFLQMVYIAFINNLSIILNKNAGRNKSVSVLNILNN